MEQRSSTPTLFIRNPSKILLLAAWRRALMDSVAACRPTTLLLTTGFPHRVRVYGCGSRPSRPVVAPGPPASSTGSCGSGSASSTVHRPPRQERGRLVGCWRASNWASKVVGRRQAEQSNAPSSSSSTADPGCCQAAEAATVTQLESGRTGTVLCARHDPRLASKMLDG